jgi:hypothetical protein
LLIAPVYQVNALPIVISALALAVSVMTAWFTLLRKGTVKMTQPTVIYFGADGGPRPDYKVFPACRLFRQEEGAESGTLILQFCNAGYHRLL